MPMGWKLFEVFAHSDFSAVRKNQKRLKELRDNHSEVTIISSHDTSEFLKLLRMIPKVEMVIHRVWL